MESSLLVREADWQQDGEALRSIRREVFVLEQAVPEHLEWDGLDAQCRHVIAIFADKPVGTGRLLPDGHVGRMAVLAPWRGKGVGRAMFALLLWMADAAGHVEVRLSAQVSAIGFYQRFGFATLGKPYMEAGIEHIEMSGDPRTATKAMSKR